MVPTGFRALPLSIVQLSLAAVLKCGQSFRWSIFLLPSPPSSLLTATTSDTESPLRYEYRLCLRDRVVCLRQSSDALFYRSVFPDPQPSATQLALRDAETLVWLNDYFQLGVDLDRLYKEWASRDAVFAKFQDRFRGIRMLRQDPWENLVSFICSSNNNISRITKMVQGLCKYYSPPLLSLPDPSNPAEVDTYHPFPCPSALSETGVSATLRSLGFGYRAEFIQRTAKMLVDSHGVASLPSDSSETSERWLKTLRTANTEGARQELLKFVGVGRKVADCILLMSLDKKEVVPVDTHVHQIAIKHYGMKGSTNAKTNMTPKLYNEVSTKLYSLWGDYAGWAHSVLFTADLKIFSSYGLTPVPPSPSVTARKRTKSNRSDLDSSLPTPPMTPLTSPLKRKLDIQSATEVAPSEQSLQGSEISPGESTLAERIKRRRRNVRS